MLIRAIAQTCLFITLCMPIMVEPAQFLPEIDEGLPNHSPSHTPAPLHSTPLHLLAHSLTHSLTHSLGMRHPMHIHYTDLDHPRVVAPDAGYDERRPGLVVTRVDQRDHTLLGLQRMTGAWVCMHGVSYSQRRYELGSFNKARGSD